MCLQKCGGVKDHNGKWVWLRYLPFHTSLIMHPTFWPVQLHKKTRGTALWGLGELRDTMGIGVVGGAGAFWYETGWALTNGGMPIPKAVHLKIRPAQQATAGMGPGIA